MASELDKEKNMPRNIRSYGVLAACLAISAAAFAAVAMASDGSGVGSTGDSGGADQPGTTIVLDNGERIPGSGKPPEGAETHKSASGATVQSHRASGAGSPEGGSPDGSGTRSSGENAPRSGTTAVLPDGREAHGVKPPAGAETHGSASGAGTERHQAR